MRGFLTLASLALLLPAALPPASAEGPDDHVQLLGRGIYWYRDYCEAEVRIIVERTGPDLFRAAMHAFPDPHLECDDWLPYLFYGVALAPIQTLCTLRGSWEVGMAGSCLYGWLQLGPYGDGTAVPVHGEQVSFRVWILGNLPDAHLDDGGV